MKKLYASLLLFTSFVSFSQLQLSPLPDYTICDQNVDGYAMFDLGSIRQMLYINYPANSYSVAFYETMNGAESGIGSLPMLYNNVIPGSQVIYAKVWETGNPNNFGITTFQLITNPAPVVNNAILTVCDDNNDEMAVFDLTTAEAEITGGMPGYMVSYYQSLADAEGGMTIAQPNNYMSMGPVTVIYVKVENMDGCNSIALLDLRVNALPYVSAPLPVISSCPLVDLTQNNNLYANYTATYHTTEADAYAGTTAIVNPAQYTATASGSVWVRVSNPAGCFIVLEQRFVISETLEIDIVQNGNTVTIDANGRTDTFIFTVLSAPLSYQGNLPLVQDNAIFTDLPAGGYTISIQDTCGNMSIINFAVIDAPYGEAEQTFTEGQTLAALNVSGNAIEWYADEPLTQQLPLTTLLADGAIYYVVSVTNGNKSIPLAITARLAAGTNTVSKTVTSLYPNPATNTITVTSQSLIDNVELYSLTGQKVMSIVPNDRTATINISGFQAGVYLVKTYTGTDSRTFKILKQ